MFSIMFSFQAQTLPWVGLIGMMMIDLYEGFFINIKGENRFCEEKETGVTANIT